MGFQGRCHDPRSGLRTSRGARTGFPITKHIRRFACRHDLDTFQHIRSRSNNWSRYDKTSTPPFLTPNSGSGNRASDFFSTPLLNQNESQTKLVVLSGVTVYQNLTRQEKSTRAARQSKNPEVDGSVSGFFGWCNKPTGQQERRRCRARPPSLVGCQPVHGERLLYPAVSMPVSGR